MTPTTQRLGSDLAREHAARLDRSDLYGAIRAYIEAVYRETGRRPDWQDAVRDLSDAREAMQCHH